MAKFFQRYPFLILIIPLGLIFYFVYVGLGWNIVVSLSRWTGLRVDYSFNGFGNYIRMSQDPVFWLSLKNTFLLFLIIPICILLGLFQALLLDWNLREQQFLEHLLAAFCTVLCSDRNVVGLDVQPGQRDH